MTSILYVSSCCSSDYFLHLMKNSCGMQQQAQKFHSLLLDGFSSPSAQKDISVQTLSAPPITKENVHKLRTPSCQMTVGNIAYNHLPVLNIPYIKNLCTLLSSFFQTRHFGKVSYKPVVICDVLNISISIGALIAAKLQGIPTVGIVTDIPKFLSNNPNSFGTRLNTTLMNAFDSYVLLTEAMTEVVNCKNKPYTVIEGQVDISMADMPNLLTDKYEKKVCLYAGGLQRIYGIPYLVQAFLKADMPDAELHIYGSGDYQEELMELCQQHPSIRYFGVKPNSDVVQAEMKATLLINPRPTTEAYTKYSFPSKNMEYMVSGTPVLTTKLPGMPAEYDDYVYLIEQETVDGLSNTLTRILSESSAALYEFGAKAKEFVLREKNNVVQAEKIIEMVKGQ